MSHARVPRDRTTQIRRVLFGLLIANLAVVGAKFIIGAATHSLAVIGDAVHSSVDAFNNVLALAVMWIAAREPDEEHPYGHTKFETLGALAIVMFLTIGGFELAKGSVDRLLHGTAPLAVSGGQLGILGATLVVNTAVAIYEARRGHQLHSDILLADAAHTRADVFITIGVLAGLLLTRAGVTFADPVIALVVAGLIVWVAWGIIRRAVPVLVDQHALPAERIRETAEQVAGVRSAYQIRSRGSPHLRFAEVTIAVDGHATVEAAHQIADAVERRLREQLQVHEVAVHVEPC
jgi:cation diffusion facilitator family transporter